LCEADASESEVLKKAKGDNDGWLTLPEAYLLRKFIWFSERSGKSKALGTRLARRREADVPRLASAEAGDAHT
jgi:hypothetical protein